MVPLLHAVLVSAPTGRKIAGISAGRTPNAAISGWCRWRTFCPA